MTDQEQLDPNDPNQRGLLVSMPWDGTDRQRRAGSRQLLALSAERKELILLGEPTRS